MTDLIIVAVVLLITLIGLFVALAIFLPPDKTRIDLVHGGGVHANDPYVGATACGDCHPGEYAFYTQSGHARTIRAVTERRLARKLDGRSAADPERPGVSWSYLLEDERFYVERTEGVESARTPVDYAFGSGHHATTFLTLTDHAPGRTRALEHRLTHFTEGDWLGITPGQKADAGLSRDGPTGYEMTVEETLKCFRCHTTTTSSEGASTLDVDTMIPNVTCETCHGPARGHVEAAHRGEVDLSMPFGYGTWTAEEQMTLCGQCHRHPSKAPPGVIRPDNLQLARFQPVGVMQSRCYTESDGAFSCVSCHDPHDKTRSDASFYEKACLNCHNMSPQPVPPARAPTGCIGCHMPRVDSGQGVMFTDHWIRQRDGRGGCTRPVPGNSARE